MFSERKTKYVRKETKGRAGRGQYMLMNGNDVMKGAFMAESAATDR